MKGTNKLNKGKAKTRKRRISPTKGFGRPGGGGGGEVVLNWLKRRQKDKARICLGEQAGRPEESAKAGLRVTLPPEAGVHKPED